MTPTFPLIPALLIRDYRPILFSCKTLLTASDCNFIAIMLPGIDTYRFNTVINIYVIYIYIIYIDLSHFILVKFWCIICQAKIVGHSDFWVSCRTVYSHTIFITTAY